jgi:hypothetical protein
VELAALDAEADLAATGITGEGLQQGLLCQVYFHSKYIVVRAVPIVPDVPQLPAVKFPHR